MHAKSYLLLILLTLLFSTLLCTPPASKRNIKKPEINTNKNTEKNKADIIEESEYKDSKEELFKEEEIDEDDFEDEQSNNKNILNYIASIYGSDTNAKISSGKYNKHSGFQLGLFLLPGPYKLSFAKFKAKKVSRKKLKLIKNLPNNLELDTLYKKRYYTILYYKKSNKKRYKIYPLVFWAKDNKYILNQVYKENGKIAIEGLNKKQYYFNLLNQNELDNFLEK